MTIQELLWRRSTVIRLALLAIGVCVFKFFPSTQASTVGDVTTIRYSWVWSLFLAGVAGWAGITSLYAAFKNNTDEPRWQLGLFGLLLVGLIIYLLPGVLLSKVTLTPEAITFEDYRTWGSKVATLELADVASMQLRITATREKFQVKGKLTMRNFLIAHYTDGSTSSALDFGLLDPYGVDALVKLSAQLGFTLTDARNESP